MIRNITKQQLWETFINQDNLGQCSSLRIQADFFRFLQRFEDTLAGPASVPERPGRLQKVRGAMISLATDVARRNWELSDSVALLVSYAVARDFSDDLQAAAREFAVAMDKALRPAALKRNRTVAERAFRRGDSAYVAVARAIPLDRDAGRFWRREVDRRLRCAYDSGEDVFSSFLADAMCDADNFPNGTRLLTANMIEILQGAHEHCRPQSDAVKSVALSSLLQTCASIICGQKPGSALGDAAVSLYASYWDELSRLNQAEAAMALSRSWATLNRKAPDGRAVFNEVLLAKSILVQAQPTAPGRAGPSGGKPKQVIAEPG